MSPSRMIIMLSVVSMGRKVSSSVRHIASRSAFGRLTGPQPADHFADGVDQVGEEFEFHRRGLFLLLANNTRLAPFDPLPSQKAIRA
jgi:hypothetical protein